MRMRLLEEGKHSILNRVVVIGLTEKISLSEDLKEMVLEAMQVYGGSVCVRLVEELV